MSVDRERKEVVNKYANAVHKVLNRLRVSGKVYQAVESPRYWSIGVKLSNPNDLSKVLKIEDEIALQAGISKVFSQRIEGSIHFDCAMPEKLWKIYPFSDSRKNQIGVGTGGTPVYFDSKFPHTLIAGTTRAGKTSLVGCILLHTCLGSPPSEVRIGIADPHGSIKGFDNSAHMIAQPARSRDEIRTLIRYFYGKFEKRKTIGETLIESSTKTEHPEMWLVIDEADSSEVFENGKNQEYLDMVANICKEGAKYRFRVILITQKPSEKKLPTIFSLMNHRIVGFLGDSSVSATVTGIPNSKANYLLGKGDFIDIFQGTVTKFQSLLPEESDYERLPQAKIKNILDIVPAIESELIATRKPTGRPKKELNPEVVGLYIRDKPSISEAREMGIGRRTHERYVEFSRRVSESMSSS